ncbi:MAG TPA: sialidase family protein [Mycobacteriales bacterium]|nr:sialidase family protein [Mycobacteriales bacterium]
MKRTVRIVVLLLLVANAGLVYYAVKHHSSQPPASGPVVVPTATTTSGPTGSAKLTQSAASVASSLDDPAPLFSAASTTIAWRASGGCTTPANLQISRNAGVTWTNAVQPAFHLLALDARSTNDGTAIGADVDCRPTTYVTRDGGRTWSPRSLAGVWFALPIGVYGPAGRITRPCSGKVLLLSSAGSNALVECSKGVYRTGNGGRSWTPAGNVTAGTVDSLALTSGGHAVVMMAASPGCRRGIRVLVSDDNGATWRVGQCLTATQTPTFVSLARDGQGETTSLSAVYRTTDYGRSWN